MVDTKILDVKINNVTLFDAVNIVAKWAKSDTKRYIVTPNVEFIISAQKDKEFLSVLNNADLSIPDSARIGWAERLLREKSLFKRLSLWPTFIFPTFPFKNDFPVTTGVDLTNELLRVSEEKGFAVGFLVGEEKVAEMLKECLLKLYPKLNIALCEVGPKVDYAGETISEYNENIRKYISDSTTQLISKASFHVSPAPLRVAKSANRQKNRSADPLISRPIDILFVGFGHIKQEKWIDKNMDHFGAKVFIGVGGALDYLSGSVPRAPKIIRRYGFEWLFRLIIQPWRIKRFGALVEFVFKVLISR